MTGTPTLDLRFDEIEGVPVVHHVGEIDMSTADEFRDRLLAALSSQAPGLVLDLTQTDYMDSSGLKVLFLIESRLREIDRGFHVVVPVDAPITSLMRVSGAADALAFDASVDDAVRTLRGQAG
jgi:anti-sigma B factor antagonist